MAVKKISYEELLIDIKAEKSSREVEPAPFFSGQSRVEKVFNTGLSVKSEGYNIFVAGPDGSGRTVYTKLKLEEASLKMEPPEGIVYYHNFEEPLKLKYILLKKGTGRYLSLKVDSIIQRLKEECIKILEDKRYEDEKIRILKQAEDRRERIFEELRDRALQHNLGVVITPTGINLFPIINGKIFPNVETLTDRQFEKFQKDVEEFEEAFREYIRELREIDHIWKRC